MRSATKSFALVPLVLAFGCASAPVPDGPLSRTVSVTGSGDVDHLSRAPAQEVDAFAARFEEHRAAAREVCCAALVKDSPDLALDLFRRALRSGDATTAEALARALARADAGDVRSSLAARAKSPDRHRAAWTTVAVAESALAARSLEVAREKARDARAKFDELGDGFGASDASLVLLLAGADEPEARRLVHSAQDARAALELANRAQRRGDASTAQERFLGALRWARGTSDLGLATDVELARTSLNVPVAPAELAEWLSFVATLALDRKRPLVAIRCALDAQRATEPATFRSRALVARAQLAGGQAAIALEAAVVVASDAREQGDLSSEASADGIAGEALVTLERLGDAAGAFERAADLARANGDSEGWARRMLNLARTQIRRGETADARTLLDTLERSLDGRGRLAARAALARACLLASTDEFAASRAAVERALATATECGDHETAEQASALKRRLGNLGT